MPSILKELKKRRINLGLKQHDMMMRIGVSRQQYQRIESRGNPRLETLELIAKGLEAELLLIPQEKLSAVRAILSDSITNPEELSTSGSDSFRNKNSDIPEFDENTLDNDPWKGLLTDEEPPKAIQ